MWDTQQPSSGLPALPAPHSLLLTLTWPRVDFEKCSLLSLGLLLLEVGAGSCLQGVNWGKQPSQFRSENFLETSRFSLPERAGACPLEIPPPPAPPPPSFREMGWWPLLPSRWPHRWYPVRCPLVQTRSAAAVWNQVGGLAGIAPQQEDVRAFCQAYTVTSQRVRRNHCHTIPMNFVLFGEKEII